MNKGDRVEYLNSFVDYEKIGHKARESFDLDRMRRLAGIFGNPERSFPAIHVAGTKGKGSTASFIANILEEAGFRVGLYTSPHVTDARERIKINSETISEPDLAHQAGIARQLLEENEPGFDPTYFEIYTAIAFNYFREKKIDYGVIEAGLGGRLDATNIVEPAVSIITPISYDHVRILGNTLADIASEKSGIIKRGATVVSAPQEAEALSVIRMACESSGVRLVLVGRDVGIKEVRGDYEKEIFNVRGAFEDYRNCRIHLIGRHQTINATSAIAAAECLREKGVAISGENIKNGIEKTRIPARCEVIGKKPYIIIDGAQNKASARALKETIRRNFKYEKLILVLGASKGKDIKGMCEELVPVADRIILTKAKSERGEEPAAIGEFMQNKVAATTDSVEKAIKEAEKTAGAEDAIVVTGSFYVAAEARRGTSPYI
ncbi:MAG: bifunctional folylpolyglutamate synthase/dihydrofolate synthase [Omnitrophica bacterium]|nr:bifunctional folylpolyglutamate synthase/dihydrofolate synthase [Candidatus Omnitrophota bacterium]